MTAAPPPYRISGYESFPCRYTWLPKAVRGLEGNNRDQQKYQVIACIAGQGFGVRREDMKKMLLATRGKVFTLKTLGRLVECSELAKFKTKQTLPAAPPARFRFPHSPCSLFSCFCFLLSQFLLFPSPRSTFTRQIPVTRQHRSTRHQNERAEAAGDKALEKCGGTP
jgi:hypothetical protein